MSLEQSGYEAAAYALSDAVIDSVGGELVWSLTPEQHTALRGLVVAVAAEAIEFGETLSTLNDEPSPLECYVEGYIDAINDLGQKEK